MAYKFADIIENKILPRVNDEGYFAVDADDFLNRYRGQLYSPIKKPDGIKLNYSKIDICNEYLAVAAAITARTGRINITTLKSELRIGYKRAKEIIDKLKQNELIGEYDRKIRAFRYTPPEEKPVEAPVLAIVPEEKSDEAQTPISPLDAEPAEGNIYTPVVVTPPKTLPLVRLHNTVRLSDEEAAAAIAEPLKAENDNRLILSQDVISRKRRFATHAGGFIFACMTTAAAAATMLIGYNAPNSSPADRNATLASFGSAASETGNPAMNKDRPIIVSIIHEATAATPVIDNKRDGMNQANTAPAQTEMPENIQLASAGAATNEPRLTANNIIANNYSLVSYNATGSLGETALARHNRLCDNKFGNSYFQAELTVLEGGPKFIEHLQKAQQQNDPSSPDGQRAAFVVNVASGLITTSSDEDLIHDADDVCSTTARTQPHMPEGPFTKGTLTLADEIQQQLENGVIAVNFGDVPPPSPYAIKTGLVTGRYNINAAGWAKLDADFDQARKIADFRITQKMAALQQAPAASQLVNADTVTRRAPWAPVL